jgi:hypothetical protein
VYYQERYIRLKEKLTEQSRLWRLNNPHLNAKKSNKRRAAKIQRTPAWLTEDDHWIIEEAYELATLRTKLFGFPWHVDHIIPLQGKDCIWTACSVKLTGNSWKRKFNKAQ